MTLTLRPATPLDLPPLYVLAQDNKSKFLDDYHSFGVDYASEIMACPHTRVIDDGYYPVGAYWLTEITDDLHAEMHMLVHPSAWRDVLRQGLSAEMLDYTFSALGVGRIYAHPMSTQRSAIRLLKRHHFYAHLPWRSHTKQGGKRVDTIFMELKRSKWMNKDGKR